MITLSSQMHESGDSGTEVFNPTPGFKEKTLSNAKETDPLVPHTGAMPSLPSLPTQSSSQVSDITGANQENLPLLSLPTLEDSPNGEEISPATFQSCAEGATPLLLRRRFSQNRTPRKVERGSETPLNGGVVAVTPYNTPKLINAPYNTPKLINANSGSTLV